MSTDQIPLPDNYYQRRGVTLTDAPDTHIYINDADPIGGYVCADCGMPTESEPCEEHQPAAYARMDAPEPRPGYWERTGGLLVWQHTRNHHGH